MTAANLDERNLNAAPLGGVINEDVMQRIWEIDRFPLVLTDMCRKDTSRNAYKEFTVDELGAPATDNAQVDGADQTGDDTVIGNRQGSWHQISTKTIPVSFRANSVDSIGGQGSLEYQVRQAQKRLRRDVEATMTTSQASAPGDALTVPSTSAGLAAWIKTNFDAGIGASAGGFNDSTGVVDAFTHGTARALTETGVRDIIQKIHEQGGDVSTMMMVPAVKRKFSEYLFTANARIATQYNTNQDTSGSTGYGTHDLFAADFGVVKLMDNRLQQNHATNESTAFIVGAPYLRQSFLRGYRVEPLARTGLSNRRLLSVDWCLLVTNEKAIGMYTDIDNTADVTFS